jgi:hypothetical protein
MIRLLKGELLKILTTRTLLGFAAAGVLLTLANVAIVGLASGDLHGLGEKQEVLSGLPILLLLLGLVGAAGEYRHRTAAPAALVADCDRGRLLAVRIAAYSVAALALATLMVAVSLGLGLPLLGRQPGPGLSGSEVAAVVAGCLAAAVLSAIIGAALGALVRNQVAAVVGALTFNFVINPLIAMADEPAAEYTPFGAIAVLAHMVHNTTVSTTAAILVLVAWTLPLVAVAVGFERRRDLT